MDENEILPPRDYQPLTSDECDIMTPEPGVDHLVTNPSETHHPTPEGIKDHNNEEADRATETQQEEGQRTPTPTIQ